ncbi:hypothetical protein [Streptomyces sp. NBC_00091]|uniref:hypothetical protein n=1 Tax=Streptomyces sp. NBC_00091 TaxID=2975648 RepID=UPI00225526B1|nr:hypothetical protein [Streptomyces sp. NBC_00091]MCX5379322.1 hypothetical protein [Streptomyces sp. NBC_00091]
MSTSTPRAAVQVEPGRTPPPPPRRHPGRIPAATLCALLGTGLLAGAATTAWSEHRASHRPLPHDAAYRKAASLWRSAPVDSLLPPVLDGPGAGPGGADRSWTRIALAPDADCAAALPADWRTALAATGCTRVLRATYTDSTRSSLITVGLVFTPADAAAMGALRDRLGVPPAYEYADARRAAWTATVAADAPAVVYAVSAFADGRTLDAPVPAEEAARQGATGIVAEAGLGHAAKGAAGRVERALATLAAPPAATRPPSREAAR